MVNLAIDIGNKKTKFGLFEGKKLLKFFDFLNEKLKETDFIEDLKKYKINRCGISSVFPELNNEIKERIKDFLKIEPIFLNYKDCGIKIDIENPEKVGIDRILNCKGAIEIFGYPCIIIDIGTAITIDVVNKNKVFTGGFILPGPELWRNSLKNTALIKEINNKKTKFLGKDTSSAINLGMEEGISGAIERIVKKIRERYKISKIILTGGWCNYFKKKLNFEKKVRKYLTLEGINIVISEND
jgi:type III pantothenate kinase